jgi:hypothetical protein
MWSISRRCSDERDRRQIAPTNRQRFWEAVRAPFRIWVRKKDAFPQQVFLHRRRTSKTA